MDTNFWNFKSKKERDDFLIALATIIGFVALLTYLLGGCAKKDIVEIADVAPIAIGADADNDGIADNIDECPQAYGRAEFGGCPQGPDSDGDGVLDDRDECPTTAGSKFNDGCPGDADNDGIFDSNDDCPKNPGPAHNKGCPLNEDLDGDGIVGAADKCPRLKGPAGSDGCPPDTDGDGIYDPEDKCPTVKGEAAHDGCPGDKDGDGIADNKDKCPELAGVTANAGCPADSDKDGVYDADDKCPKEKGTAANAGCPSDRDKDGVPDIRDKCPDKPGVASNRGCPEMAAEDKQILKEAVKAVEFETSSAVLKGASKSILDKVVDILKRYPEAKVAIQGHTDSQGDDTKNLTLSNSRAKTCYDYIVANGIAANRLNYKGFGETKPIATNDTAEGRKRNRRVEFNLNY